MSALSTHILDSRVDQVAEAIRSVDTRDYGPDDGEVVTREVAEAAMAAAVPSEAVQQLRHLVEDIQTMQYLPDPMVKAYADRARARARDLAVALGVEH